MRHFQDQKTTIKDGDTILKYSDLIKLCLEKAPVQGLNIEQMRKNMKILDKFEKMKSGKLELEELEWATIKAAVGAFPWAMMHKDIIALGDYLDSVK
jgi:hypothetical protein